MKVVPVWIGGKPLKYDSETREALNIYKKFYPLAYLSKMSMVLPVTNITSDENLKFNLFSLEVLYVFVMNIFIGCFMASQIYYDDSHPPNIIKQSIAFLISNLWFVAGQHLLIKLMRKIDQFDNSLLFKSKIEVLECKHKNMWVLASLGYPLILFIMVIMSWFQRDTCTQYRCSLMEAIRGYFLYQHQLQLIIYMFYCVEIRVRFETLNAIFNEFVKTLVTNELKREDLCSQFEHQRLQHANLVQCTKILNQLFGWRFVLILGTLVMQVVHLLYYFHTETDYIINGYDLIYFAYSFIVLMFATHITDLVVIEVSATISLPFR